MKTGLVVKKSAVKGLGSIVYYFGHSASSENVGERGLSHFAEHLLCKSFDHLLPKIKSYSISYDASTGDNSVQFYWTGLDEKLSELEPEFMNLFDFVPTKEQFELERNIILQEYVQTFSGQYSIFYNINRKYFNSYGPIGCKQDIETISYEDFLKFFERFKHPTNIYRVTSNNKSDVKAIYENVVYKKPLVLKKVRPSELCIEQSSTFPNSVLLSDWLEVPEFNLAELNLLIGMFSSGLASPLYKEIRETRGLVYSLGLYTDKFRDKLNFQFVANCSPENVEEVRKIAKEVLTNPKTYLTKDRFDDIKMSKITAKQIENINNHNVGTILQEIEYGDTIFKTIQATTFERLMEVAEQLKVKIESGMTLCSLGATLEI